MHHIHGSHPPSPDPRGAQPAVSFLLGLCTVSITKISTGAFADFAKIIGLGNRSRLLGHYEHCSDNAVTRQLRKIPNFLEAKLCELMLPGSEILDSFARVLPGFNIGHGHESK